jgi:hypothetical protein
LITEWAGRFCLRCHQRQEKVVWIDADVFESEIGGIGQQSTKEHLNRR